MGSLWRKFGRFASLLVALLGAVSFWTDIVWAQEQIAIYRVLPTQVTREAVLKLAREAFGMSSPQLSETDIGFVVREGSKRLQVTKASGALLFADDSKLWNLEYRPRLPSESEAIRQATEFLRKHKLLPPQADPDQTGLPAAAITRGLASVQANNHVEVNYYFFINPGFGRVPFPGNAPGGLLQVALGEGGEVIGLMWRWRAIEQVQQRPLLSPAQARELLCWKLQLPLQNCSQLPDPGLIYSVWSDLDIQTAVYPLYLFLMMGTGYGVPATDFPVLARIRAPSDGAQIAPGMAVEFRAEIHAGFGSAPYSYAWRSTLDGELGQAAVFRKALSPGTHIISLTVADQNGTVDVQYIQITVIGSSGESAPGNVATASGGNVDVRALAGLLGVVVVILGLIGRRHGSRWGLVGVWLAVSLSLSGASPSWQAQAVAGNFFNDGGPDFTGTLSLTEHGLRLRDFKWQNFFIAREISIPFVDVEVNVAGVTKQVRLKLDPKKAGAIQQVNVLQGQCPNDPAQRVYGKSYQVSYKGLPVNLELPGWGAGSLDVKLSYYFYRPRPTLPAAAPRGVNCQLGRRDHPYRIAPEFYFQAQYDLKLPPPPQGQAVPKLEKVRFAYRMDFDVQGGQNEIPALVREFIDEFKWQVVANIFQTGIMVVTSCTQPQLVAAGAKPVNMRGRQAQILCLVAPGPTPGQVLDGNPTQNTYDNYHQAAGWGMWIPYCSAPDTPCVHMHLRHLELGPRASAKVQGRGFAGWPREQVEHTFTIVEYQGKAGQPQEPDPATVNLPQAQLPVDLAQNQLNVGIRILRNPVLWYVVESTQLEETFFAFEPVDFLRLPPPFPVPGLLDIWVPLHWAGFSCNLQIVKPASPPIPTC